MKIYLIRHGETDWNKKKLLQGQVDMPLNENGRYVAYLTHDGIKELHFDIVYSSPLQRAYDTAKIVTGGDIPIIQDERLQEITFGKYEGVCISKEGYNLDDPEFLNFFRDPENYKKPEGGESVEELIARTGEFLEELIAKPELQDKSVLLSMHGASVRALLVYIQKLPIRDFWKGGVHRNCAITTLNYNNRKISIESENVIYYDESLSTNYDD